MDNRQADSNSDPDVAVLVKSVAAGSRRYKTLTEYSKQRKRFVSMFSIKETIGRYLYAQESSSHKAITATRIHETSSAVSCAMRVGARWSGGAGMVLYLRRSCGVPLSVSKSATKLLTSPAPQKQIAKKLLMVWTGCCRKVWNQTVAVLNRAMWNETEGPGDTPARAQ